VSCGTFSFWLVVVAQDGIGAVAVRIFGRQNAQSRKKQHFFPWMI